MLFVNCYIVHSHVQVKVNFVPVGHTHEDVDQLFSKITAHIRQNGAESMSG